MSTSGYHIGLLQTGAPSLEGCSCIKAPCGLMVLEEALADCPHHSWKLAPRQEVHPAYSCPGK